jgi:hypothetical protein
MPAVWEARQRLWQAWDTEVAKALWRARRSLGDRSLGHGACERLDVHDTVCWLVAAYLVSIGAALSDAEVPAGHLNALM